MTIKDIIKSNKYIKSQKLNCTIEQVYSTVK